MENNTARDTTQPDDNNNNNVTNDQNNNNTLEEVSREPRSSPPPDYCPRGDTPCPYPADYSSYRHSPPEYQELAPTNLQLQPTLHLPR